MSFTAPRILVVDDNPSIHEDFDKILRPGDAATTQASLLSEAEALLFGSAASGAFPVPAGTGRSFDLAHAMQGQEGLAQVQAALAEGRPFSVAFIDMRMPPGWDGLETAARILSVDPGIQIVICTAYSDYSWDEIRSRLGVPDGLLILKKPFDVVEVLQIAHNLTRKWELACEIRASISELDRRVEARTAELLASRERFAIMFQSAPLAQMIVDSRGFAGLEVNAALCRLTGYSIDHWQDAALAAEAFESTGLGALVRRQQPLSGVEAVIRHRDQSARHIIVSSVVLGLSGLPALLLMIQDFTEHQKLESDVRQLQKMEAVGQLAAGVAHDFNNLLTVIGGNSRLLKDAFTNKVPFEVGLIDEIIDSSSRAADMTRKLLAFTRRHVFQPEPVHLNSLVEKQLGLLSRLLGEHIEILWHPDTHGCTISADSASLEQVILNLTVNARDAMPEGGRLTLAASRVSITSPQEAARFGIAPGDYGCLTCADTGHGMTQEVAERVFEPFFTTKETGKGTGLGLSSVYGIVKRHHGGILLDSTLGHGTTIRVLLPVLQSGVADPEALMPPAASSAHPRSPQPPAHPPRRGLRVLLIEDEPAVRRIGTKLLAALGHQVVEASDGPDGLAKWNQCRKDIDIVITDMVMPGGLSGLSVADAIQTQEPAVPVILASGYSDELLEEQGAMLSKRRIFLPKPYCQDTLSNVIEKLPDFEARHSRSAEPVLV
jgi:PAS domain S-box-containing protein